MPELAAARCLNHPEREAAARCPQCRRHFCRECVTEHGGRMLCASCIAESLAAAAPAVRKGAWRRALRPLAHALRVAAALLAAWIFFHTLGQTFALWPEATHAVRAAASATDDEAPPP